MLLRSVHSPLWKKTFTRSALKNCMRCVFLETLLSCSVAVLSLSWCNCFNMIYISKCRKYLSIQLILGKEKQLILPINSTILCAKRRYYEDSNSTGLVLQVRCTISLLYVQWKSVNIVTINNPRSSSNLLLSTKVFFYIFYFIIHSIDSIE